jgi:hypothetical protein
VSATGARAWKPPARPAWVERLIAHGEAVGGAANLVSLEAEDLLATARRSTDLADFGAGDGAWRTHYERFVRALHEESELHLAGRILVRSELLRTLRNRLQLTALWRERPALLEAPVPAPVFIVGAARSGTSILHELMACDPATRAPAMWEMQHPVSAATGSADDHTAELADRTERFWADLQPEYETMHQNSGRLPNECIFVTLHEFLSDHWGGCHVVPGYEAHLARADHVPAYRFHRRFLQTLQSRGGPRRWLLKAPSHLSQLRALFTVYPDAWIVRTHRDPASTLPSMIDLLGTLKWMRCTNVDMTRAARVLPAAFAALFQREIDERASGALPGARFIDVHFRELTADPAGTVARIYDRLGWPFPPDVRAAITDYAARKPRGARGAHRYSAESTGLDPGDLRERFAFYREHYGIEEERSG